MIAMYLIIDARQRRGSAGVLVVPATSNGTRSADVRPRNSPGATAMQRSWPDPTPPTTNPILGARALDLADQPHDDDADLLADTAVDKVLYRLAARHRAARRALRRAAGASRPVAISLAARDYRGRAAAARAAGCKPDRQACHALGFFACSAQRATSPAAQQFARRRALHRSLRICRVCDQAWRSRSARALQKAVVLRELGDADARHPRIHRRFSRSCVVTTRHSCSPWTRTHPAWRAGSP